MVGRRKLPGPYWGSLDALWAQNQAPGLWNRMLELT